MVLLPKGCKPDNFKSRNSVKRSFITIRVFVQVLLNVNLSFNQILMTFLLYVRQNVDGSLDSDNFSVRGYHSKGFYYSHAWSCSLYEERTSFCTGLIS